MGSARGCPYPSDIGSTWTVYSAAGTPVYSVAEHQSVYSVQCTVYSVQCTVYSAVYSAVYSVQCTVQCTVHHLRLGRLVGQKTFLPVKFLLCGLVDSLGVAVCDWRLPALLPLHSLAVPPGLHLTVGRLLNLSSPQLVLQQRRAVTTAPARPPCR